MSATISRFKRLNFATVSNQTDTFEILSGEALVLVFASRGDVNTFNSVLYAGSGSLTPVDTVAASIAGGISILAAGYSGLAGNSSAVLDVTMDTTPVFGHCYALAIANPDYADLLGDFDTLADFISPALVTNTSDENAVHFGIGYWRDTLAVIDNGQLALAAGNSQTAIGSPFENANGNTVWATQRPGAASTATLGFESDDSSFSQYQIGAIRINGTGGGGAPDPLMLGTRKKVFVVPQVIQH